MTQIVPLTRGFVAVVDDEDMELASQSKWHAQESGTGKNAYAQRTRTIDGRKKKEFLHRVLMGSPDAEVDHINGNGLDNRRSNLRIVSRGENAQNMGAHSDGASRYVGVSPGKNGAWRAAIHVDGAQKYLGQYAT